MSEHPWIVGIHEVRRNPGIQKPVGVAAPLPGSALSSAVVDDDADVVADLVLEAMTDGRITVTGTVRAPWTGECRRCLDPVGGVAETRVQEVFEPSPADDADTYPLDVDRIDLEPMVRDAVLLSLPLAPLCRDDCPGPDPDEHPVTVEGDLADAEPPVDPRWAALDQLKLAQEQQQQ